MGNLATGGTGKTPMTEYLIRLLKNDFKTATLSRGYKRKTVGFAIANEDTTALEIGDEPMQFHQKFPDIAVAVGEERIVAIPQLLHERPETEVIILDDAFQHRWIGRDVDLVVIDQSFVNNQSFFTHNLLPLGDLREGFRSLKRADAIILNRKFLEKEEIKSEMKNCFEGKKIFDGSGNFVSVHLIKGGAAPVDMHGVDAVSGGTITSTGVSEMLQRTISNYLPYFKTVKESSQ